MDKQFKGQIEQIDANRWRVGDAYFANNFGLLEIDWQAPGVGLELRVHAEDGQVLMRQALRLDQLQARRNEPIPAMRKEV